MFHINELVVQGMERNNEGKRGSLLTNGCPFRCRQCTSYEMTLGMNKQRRSLSIIYYVL